MNYEPEIKKVYGTKANLLRIVKDSVCFGLEDGMRGINYPYLQNFDGYLIANEVPKLRDELEDIRRKSSLEWVVEEEGEFVPIKIIPADRPAQTGFAAFLPDLHKEYPNLLPTDFILLLLNDCNEAIYKKRDLDVKKALKSNLGV